MRGEEDSHVDFKKIMGTDYGTRSLKFVNLNRVPLTVSFPRLSYNVVAT
jgi:hypothetical protein